MRTETRPAAQAAPEAAEAPAAPGAETTELRADMERLLSAADAAIERALSVDSEAFLAAHRQQGGQ